MAYPHRETQSTLEHSAAFDWSLPAILVQLGREQRAVTQAVIACAQHVTLPLPLLLEMGNHPLSDQAVEEFSRTARTS